ncbi:MAG: ABC transporter permease [Anaerolineae bacterium]|nr:ABC transporter permease [Anaerolineae bacterium]
MDRVIESATQKTDIPAPGAPVSRKPAPWKRLGALVPLLQDAARVVILSVAAGGILYFFAEGTSQLVIEARATDNLAFDTIFPSVGEIADAWDVHQDRLLHDHIPSTMWITLTGLAMALVLGVVIAALMDFSPLLRWILYPALVISQTIPVFALAVLLILIFGFGSGPKIVVVVLFCFFPVALNTFTGLQSAEPELLSLLRAMGANAFQVWTKARLPAAMPSFFSGVRIAATYSVVGAIFGEYITAQQGLGVFLKRSYSSFRLDQAYLAIILTAVLSLLLVLLVNLVERLALRWYYTSRRRSWRGPGIY